MATSSSTGRSSIYTMIRCHNIWTMASVVVLLLWYNFPGAFQKLKFVLMLVLVFYVPTITKSLNEK